MPDGFFAFQAYGKQRPTLCWGQSLFGDDVMLYRAAGVAFAVLALAGTAQAQKTHKPATPPPPAADAPAAPDAAAVTAADVLREATRAGRATPDGAGLSLVLTSGRHLRMVNNTRGCPRGDQGLDDGNCYRYVLLGDLPEQHAFIVGEDYYEGESLFLVDDRTGRQTGIDGIPVFSPDGSRFFINDDDEANDHDNNIEIWRRDGDGAVIEWAHPWKQVYVEAPALKEIYHVSVSDWSKPETISLAFSSGRRDWDGHLTLGAKGWTLDADWPKE